MEKYFHIFDTHSHYDDARFEGRGDELIASLFNDGISGIIHAATDFESARFGLKMSEKYPRYYTSVGIHPEYADCFSEDDILSLEKLARASEKVVAIGEIGLDYHYEGYDRECQTRLFRTQTELANRLGLPVIVHCRDAVGDCMDILRELRPRGVMHCFSGSVETAREVLSLGMYLGFTGALTFKNAKKPQEVVRTIPLDRLLLETDCPYLAPEPHRGEVCSSGLIEFTAKKAAELKGIGYEELLSATEENAERLFGIKK